MINLRDLGADLWERSNKFTRILIAVTTVALFATLPFLGGTFLNTPVAEYESVLVFPIAIFVIMALGLNTWEILPIGIAMAMLAGLVLGVPALRLRGDYLAIITLGFGEIVRITALNINAIGGANGIIGIPTPPTIFGLEYTFDNHRLYFWTFLIIILLTIWMIRRLSARRGGRAWESIRQDEDAAELMGVTTFRYKIWAFVLGASVGGAAGVLYASKTLFISPDNFTLQVSILILACVIFGGMGNIWGVILGAVVLGYLPDRIRFLSDARLLVFGLVLVLMMNLRPDGVLPRKKREKALIKKEIK